MSLGGPVHSELVIKKSRFIGCVQAVPDRAAAQAVVAALWAEHPTATHVCWALLAGGQSAAVDDGEPSGTAGRPMLEVLRRQDLEGVLATVVRYYGGTPLGAGGLVRAYTDTVAQALLTASKVQLQRMKTLQCLVPYAQEGLLRREIDAAGAELVDVQHGTLVTLHAHVGEKLGSEGIAHASRGKICRHSMRGTWGCFAPAYLQRLHSPAGLPPALGDHRNCARQPVDRVHAGHGFDLRLVGDSAWLATHARGVLHSCQQHAFDLGIDVVLHPAGGFVVSIEARYGLTDPAKIFLGTQ